MKNLLLILFAGSMLASCNFAKFDRIPGERVDNLPIEIQGTFDVVNNLIESQTKDSFSIVIDNNSIKQLNAFGVDENKINEKFYMYRLNDLFIIGTPDENFGMLWNLTVIEPVRDGLRVYPIWNEKPKPAEPSKTAPYFAVREIPMNHEPIIALPDPKGGMATPPLGNDGGTNTILKYFIMNDDQFFSFFEKELKGKEYIFIKKHKINDKKSKKK